MALGFYSGAGRPPNLPHPPISLAVFLVVEEGIRAAWQLMRSKPRSGFDLLNADEDEVTHELYERLYEEVFDNNVVDGFDRELLTSVTRESKLRSYNGDHLDKMPDLIFGLVDRPNVYFRSQDWIFVECKPVDKTHTLGVHYCGKGIIRFVQGEYAWAMTSALMVGYTHKGYEIVPKLIDALTTNLSVHTVSSPSRCRRSASGPSSEAVYISRHERKFTYVQTGRAAGAITIRHLWLKRD